MPSSDIKRARIGEALKRQAALAKGAMRLSIAHARSAPQLVSWRLGASMLSGAVQWAAIGAIIGALALSAISAQGLIAAIDALLQTLTSSRFVLGATGALAASTAIGWLVMAWSDAQVWASYQRACASPEAPDDAPVALWPWLGRALAWRALRDVMRLGLGLLGAMVYVALIKHSALEQGVLGALVLATIYAAMIVFALWVSATLEIAPALMATEDLSLGEALLEGADVAPAQGLGLYRVLIFGALMLTPALLIQGASVALGSIAPSGAGLTLFQVGAAIIWLVSTVIAGVLCRGASFYYVAMARAHAPKLRHLALSQLGEGTPSRFAQLGTPDGQGGVIVSLRDMLPEHPPEPIAISALLSHARSPHAPQGPAVEGAAATTAAVSGEDDAAREDDASEPPPASPLEKS